MSPMETSADTCMLALHADTTIPAATSAARIMRMTTSAATAGNGRAGARSFAFHRARRRSAVARGDSETIEEFSGHQIGCHASRVRHLFSHVLYRHPCAPARRDRG